MLIFSIWYFTETSKLDEVDETVFTQNLIDPDSQRAEQPNQAPALLIEFGENENASQESLGMSQYFIYHIHDKSENSMRLLLFCYFTEFTKANEPDHDDSFAWSPFY